AMQYVLDSFPVELCDDIRIKRCRLAQDEKYRGKCAAKRRYFYGVKVHVVMTEGGLPVEFAFLPGHASDVRGLEALALELPPGSELFMDSGYTDYAAEDAVSESDTIRFSVCRKKNSRRRDAPAESYYKTLMRKRIETVFSQITRLFPKRIHAVSLKGFLMKLSFFIIAFTLDRAFI
ncbi:MAG TPA: IS982 family transposase, partial [Blastocatellia bacterium]|nr:IS982 family transposase [Blastocatellia bacterium]